MGEKEQGPKEKCLWRHGVHRAPRTESAGTLLPKWSQPSREIHAYPGHLGPAAVHLGLEGWMVRPKAPIDIVILSSVEVYESGIVDSTVYKYHLHGDRNRQSPEPAVTGIYHDFNVSSPS